MNKFIKTSMVFSANNKKIHYDKKYLAWQKKAGLYGAEQDLWMYQSLINQSDRVLDFGCGGGYLLARLKCRSRYGVDINPSARQEAENKGIKVFAGLDKIPRSLKFDAIISHHTLEHTENPAEILKSIKKYLKKDGFFICVVPIDDWRIEKKYDPDDINKHLYTWTPLLFGNLLTQTGFKIKEIKIIERAWVPLSRFYYRYAPKFAYNFISMLWSKLTLSRQIRVVVHLLILYYFNFIT